MSQKRAYRRVILKRMQSRPTFSSTSLRTLFIALAAIIALAGLYFLLVALSGQSAREHGSAAPLSIEQKAEVLHALSQTSPPPSAEPTNAETKAQLRAIQNVSKSSGSVSPSETQSDAAKLKVLNSLNAQ